jgi:ketosteroid isomerase-like protein
MSDTDTIVREVEAFYRAYIDGFNREDTDAFLQSFAYPHALLTGERGLLVTATASDQRRFHQQTMASLHERGWGRSGIDHLQIWPLADALAMIVADVTRYKKDESVLEKLRACYVARRDAGTWKILTFMEIKPPFTGPGS